MQMKAVAERAKQQMADLTGLKPVTVAGAFRDAQGWRVSLDLLELSRIPQSTDVLGTYEVLLDEEGNLVSFERKRTRFRGEPMEEEEAGRDDTHSR